MGAKKLSTHVIECLDKSSYEQRILDDGIANNRIANARSLGTCPMCEHAYPHDELELHVDNCLRESPRLFDLENRNNARVEPKQQPSKAEPSTSELKYECTLCTESSRLAALIPCGHVYCVNCMKKHKPQKSHAAKCPCCRKDITSILSLYFP
jgi:hypothetical protein